MLNQTSTKMHPRTDSLLQFQLLKGTYYNDKGQFDDNIIQGASILLQYKEDDVIRRKLNEFVERLENVAALSSRKKMSSLGEIYVEEWERRDIDSRIVHHRTNLAILRQEIIRFLVSAMEERGIMEKPITRLQLQKLPLIFKGGFHETQMDSGVDEEEDSDVEEVDEEIEM